LSYRESHVDLLLSPILQKHEYIIPMNQWKAAMLRTYSLTDKLLMGCDRLLRTLSARNHAARVYPAAEIAEEDLTDTQRRCSSGCMRVNHTGEVCAQALYQGQAIFARDPCVQAKLQQSAAEEVDHLAWCETRLRELKSHPSRLNLLWYVGAFSLGVVAGLAGDKWNLGFVQETERQVEAHLDGHLARIAPQDKRSRAVIEQMKLDENHHAEVARQAGAAELPEIVKQIMRYTAKLMTTTTYWV
jgi:ubiquinone biosynthesis monooxygenase Coq7